MKKTLVILACLFAGLWFVAWLFHEPNIPEELPIVELYDVDAFVGEKVMLRERITQVRKWRGYTFVNFGGRYPNQTFTVVIKPDFPHEIGWKAGDVIEVGGLIELYKGKPQIVAEGKETFCPNYAHQYQGIETAPGLRGPEPLDF